MINKNDLMQRLLLEFNFKMIFRKKEEKKKCLGIDKDKYAL